VKANFQIKKPEQAAKQAIKEKAMLFF